MHSTMQKLIYNLSINCSNEMHPTAISLMSFSQFISIVFFLQIVFVDDKDLQTVLLNDIDESQLPDVYGGKLQLVGIGD